MRRFFSLFFCLFFSGFALCSCGEKNSDVPVADFSAGFPVGLGDKTLALRLALTDVERAQGLMGTQGLHGNDGMLFVYADARKRAFWMKNVSVDLALGYFDSSGTLLEIHALRAQNLRSTESKSDRVKFVLEMRSGWFEENGVHAGTRLDLTALAHAVRKRGFSGERFGLH